MKKVYEIPQIEVMQVESTELMQASMGPWSDETINDKGSILTRDVIFMDEE